MNALRSANGPRNVRQPQTLASYAARIEAALETAEKLVEEDYALAYGYLAQTMKRLVEEFKAAAAEPTTRSSRS